MPRRLPVRPQVIIGNIFVVLVSWVIGVIYYAYVFLVWLPKAEGKCARREKAELMNDSMFVTNRRRLARGLTPRCLPPLLLYARVVIHTVNDD